MLLISNFFILKSLFPLLAFLLAWELTWKWIALYQAWKKWEIWRFICIFIFKTFWILPIIYLIINSTEKNVELSTKRNNINKEIKQTKKTSKGGAKKWENAMLEKKQKEMQNAFLKKRQKKTTKKT